MTSTEPTMSRRDWFRLRKPRSEASPSQSNPAQIPAPTSSDAQTDFGSSSALKPIALPPNHDGMDLAALPAMREAQLSLEEVLALLADIERDATDVHLLQRERRPQTRAEPIDSARAIEVARQAIKSGSISRLQIRYRWQGAAWIDTLESLPSHFRLVRIEHRQ